MQLIVSIISDGRILIITVLPSGVFQEMVPWEVAHNSSPIFFFAPVSCRLMPSPVSNLFFLFKRGDINKCLKAIEKLDS